MTTTVDVLRSTFSSLKSGWALYQGTTSAADMQLGSSSPGMPNFLFLIASGLTLFIWWTIKKQSEDSAVYNEMQGTSNDESDVDQEKDENSISLLTFVNKPTVKPTLA